MKFSFRNISFLFVFMLSFSVEGKKSEDDCDNFLRTQEFSRLCPLLYGRLYPNSKGDKDKGSDSLMRSMGRSAKVSPIKIRNCRSITLSWVHLFLFSGQVHAGIGSSRIPKVTVSPKVKLNCKGIDQAAGKVLAAHNKLKELQSRCEKQQLSKDQRRCVKRRVGALKIKGEGLQTAYNQNCKNENGGNVENGKGNLIKDLSHKTTEGQREDHTKEVLLQVDPVTGNMVETNPNDVGEAIHPGGENTIRSELLGHYNEEGSGDIEKEVSGANETTWGREKQKVTQAGTPIPELEGADKPNYKSPYRNNSGKNPINNPRGNSYRNNYRNNNNYGNNLQGNNTQGNNNNGGGGNLGNLLSGLSGGGQQQQQGGGGQQFANHFPQGQNGQLNEDGQNLAQNDNRAFLKDDEFSVLIDKNSELPPVDPVLAVQAGRDNGQQLAALYRQDLSQTPAKAIGQISASQLNENGDLIQPQNNLAKTSVTPTSKAARAPASGGGGWNPFGNSSEEESEEEAEVIGGNEEASTQDYASSESEDYESNESQAESEEPGLVSQIFTQVKGFLGLETEVSHENGVSMTEYGQEVAQQAVADDADVEVLGDDYNEVPLSEQEMKRSVTAIELSGSSLDSLVNETKGADMPRIRDVQVIE